MHSSCPSHRSMRCVRNQSNTECVSRQSCMKIWCCCCILLFPSLFHVIVFNIITFEQHRSHVKDSSVSRIILSLVDRPHVLYIFTQITTESQPRHWTPPSPIPISTMISTLFQPPVNSTLLTLITPSAVQPPFYHTTRPSILSFISDKHLSLALPVLVYWGLSLLFHLVEVLKIPYFEARKVHDSPEVLSRNRATISQVVKAVVWQHVLQTILGYLWLEDDEILLRKQLERDDLGGMASLTPMVAKGVMLVVGPRTGQDVFKSHGEAIVRWMYWWGMPSAKLFLAL